MPVQMLWFCGSLTDNPGVAHGQCLTPKGPDADAHAALRAAMAGSVPQEVTRPSTPGLRFTWISDAGVERTSASHTPRPGTPVTGDGSGTLAIAAGDTSGALIVASRAANAVNVPLPNPAADTQMLGEPTLTLDYSGTATNSDGRLYAQIVSNANGLVLGNQVTPIPVTLDGRAHTLTIPLEAVAADVASGSTYTLQITDGTTVYFAARGAGLVTMSKIALTVPTVAPGSSHVVTGVTPTGSITPPGGASSFSCAAPTGRIAGRSLGPVSLGMTRARARKAFPRVSTRGRPNMDFFCPTNGYIRVGYASAGLLRGHSARQRRTLSGRVVLAVTGNGHFAAHGIRHGTPLAVARRRLHLTRYGVGLNDWYTAPDGRVRAVLKVRRGTVQEIGIANPSLTGSRRATARFLGGFSFSS